MPSRKEVEGMMGGHECSGLPVDEGWSWVIMTGHFVMTLVMAGYGRALSLFLMEFVVMFESSVAAATLSYAVMTAAFGIGNVLVTHVLLSRFDTRHVILTGAVLGSVAMVMCSIAPGIILIVCLHIVIGLSHAMMHTSSVTLMGPYFQARRGLANAVSNTGHSISALLVPPLTQFFITSYGTRGAILLVAGIQMQGIVAGFLMRPVEFYTRRNRKRGESGVLAGRTSAGEIALDETAGESLAGEGKSGGKVTGDVASVREEGVSSTGVPEKQALLTEKSLVPHQDPPPPKLSAAGELQLPPPQREQQQPLCVHTPDVTDGFLTEAVNGFQGNAGSRKSSSENTDMSRPDTERESPFRASPKFSEGDRVRFVKKDREEGETENRVSEVTDVSSVCPENVGCNHTSSETCEGFTLPDDQERDYEVSIHVAPLDRSSEKSPKVVESSQRKTCCTACVSVTSKVMDLSLLRNWCFLLIMTYFPFGQTNAFLAIFLPALGVERGLSHTQAALLLTVMGGVDLVSRLLMGMLADTGLVRRTRIVATALTFLSAACLFAGLYTDFTKLAMFSVMFGLCGGTNQNMLVVVVVELLGLPHLRGTLGMALLMQSLCLSLTHPILGSLVDWTGSYVVVYYYVGGCLAIAVLVLLTEPLARKLESRRMRKMDDSKPNDQ